MNLAVESYIFAQGAWYIDPGPKTSLALCRCIAERHDGNAGKADANTVNRRTLT